MMKQVGENVLYWWPMKSETTIKCRCGKKAVWCMMTSEGPTRHQCKECFGRREGWPEWSRDVVLRNDPEPVPAEVVA